MRKTTFTVAAASSLILTVIAGWTTGSSRSVQANASTEIAAQIDTFSMMASRKGLSSEEFQDFSLVFSAPGAKGRSPMPTP
jgi:hypothetical protein